MSVCYSISCTSYVTLLLTAVIPGWMHHSMWTINSPMRAICPWQQWFQLSSSCFWTSPSLDGLYFYNRTTRSWLGTGSFYLATPFYTCSQLLNVDIVMISFCIFDKLLRKWRSHCSDHCVNPLQQFPRNKSVTSWQLPRVSYSFIHSGMQRVSSARRRHHSPEWTILSHVNCFIQGEVQWFQVLLGSLHPRSTGASQWYPAVLQGRSC